MEDALRPFTTFEISWELSGRLQQLEQLIISPPFKQMCSFGHSMLFDSSLCGTGEDRVWEGGDEERLSSFSSERVELLQLSQKYLM